MVTVEKVRELLLQYGLVTKELEPLCDARVLGVRVRDPGDRRFVWCRDSKLPLSSESTTKRELFSICGKLVGHYPIAGWLRAACSLIKRTAGDVKWDEKIPAYAEEMIREVLARVSKDNLVKGMGEVNGGEGGVAWCDASSLSVGSCLQIDGHVVEDCAWLRRDVAHINLAELEAAIKGIRLALKRRVRELQLMTDSANVYGWIRSVSEETKRPKVSGLRDMVVKRRLKTISQLIEEYGLTMSIKLVPSEQNVADALTCVPKKWLQRVAKIMSRQGDGDRVVAMGVGGQRQSVVELRNRHHSGVERAIHVVDRMQKMADRAVVAEVVRSCKVTWEHGHLDVDAN